MSFNPIDGVCNFTRNYCKRYGIDFKRKTWKDSTEYTDCELSGEQEVLEAIFGETITRKAKEYWNNPLAIPADMQDTYKQREERYGTAAAVALSVADPFGIGEGIGLNIQEQLAGRDKYCITGDTVNILPQNTMVEISCLECATLVVRSIHHNWSFQNQVKQGEDHTFYVPEGVISELNVVRDGRNFSYDEIPENGKKISLVGQAKSINHSAPKPC